MKKKTHEEYVNELAVKNPNVEVIGTYVGNKIPILHKCHQHHVEWLISPDNALSGKGCSKCKCEKYRKSRTKTHDEYVNEVKLVNPNIDVIEKYVSAKTPILHVCKTHNVEWMARPYNILLGMGCSKCKSEKIIKSQTKEHQQYVIEVASTNPNVEVIEEYINGHTPILHRCKIHNVEWKIRPYEVLGGHGCNQCRIDKMRNASKKDHQQYVEELNLTNNNIMVVGEYVNARTHILHKCLLCGNEWDVTPDSLLRGTGCPKCKTSLGEKKIAQLLEDNKIHYIRQYKFDDCKDIRSLPFDFYLPEYNLLIEYDGQQHFEPVDYFGGEDDFKIIQLHDQIKTQYCKQNNICLLRISYQQDIEEELNNFLLI